MNIFRTLFAALLTTVPASTAAAAERRIEKEITIDAPRHEVWHAWTTTEGVTSFAPQAAKIELRIGGPYEWYFAKDAPAGSRGSEGARILAFVPNQLLAFSWNAPPKTAELRKAGVMTQVFVRFEELDPNQTKVKLTHLITETGPDWDIYKAYFEAAWPSVLVKCKAALEKPDRKAMPAPAADAVPPLVQTAEFAAPVERLWQALTDPAVAKKWMAAQVEMEIKLGGKYRANYNPAAPVNDDSWINRDVVAFDPGRLLIVKMTQAPAKFPFKKSIEATWHVFECSPTATGSRLTLTMAGMPETDEAKQMRAYFEKANLTVFARLKEVLEPKP